MPRDSAEVRHVVRLPDDATEERVAGSAPDDPGGDDAAEALARAADELAAIGQVDRLLERLVVEGLRLTGADEGEARLLERRGRRSRGRLRRAPNDRPGNTHRVIVSTTSSDRSELRTVASVSVRAPDGRAVAVLDFHAHHEAFGARERRLLTWLARIAAPALLRTLDVQHAEEEARAVRREAQRWRKTAQQLADPETPSAHGAQALGRAVAATAHDLRTPLATLDGYVWLLERQQARTSAESDLIDGIRRQIRQLDALADELQVAVRHNPPDVSANPISVDVTAVARQAARDLRIALPGADVAVHAGPTIPALVDPGHLHRMLTNLLTNAVRYGRPPVEIRTSQRAGRVTVTVTDTGPGVPPPFVPCLFDRFTRGPTEADVPDGTGLGLAIVRALASANDATIRYRPNQPQGASFEIDLPAASAD